MALTSRRKTRFLFCTRAGARLRHLYLLFCGSRGLAPIESELFPISRFAAAKIAFCRDRQVGLQIVAREFSHARLRDAAVSLLRSAGAPADLAGLPPAIAALLDQTPTPELLARFLDDGGDATGPVLEDFARGGSDFATFLQESGPCRFVLIDTGWEGTTQHLLAAAHPEHEFIGAYFGFGGFRPEFAVPMLGVGLAASRYGTDLRSRWETIQLNHHVIEDALEPPWPSVECFSMARLLELNAGDPLAHAAPEPEGDEHYAGIVHALPAMAGLTRYEVVEAGHAAWRQLHRILAQPTAAEVRMVAPRARSADFGKIERNPVVFLPGGTTVWRREERLRRALWSAGQRALEEQVVQVARGASRAEPRRRPAPRMRGPDAAVAVVTRTKDRPLMLRRAARSVLGQSFRDIVWVVVNDCGDPRVVNETLEESAFDRSRLIVVHNDVPRGMEHASALGIKATRSKYVLIHDDDDTLHPDFLRQMVSHLDRAPNPVKGAVSSCVRIDERIVDNRHVEVLSQSPYNPWIKTIDIAEMMANNTFAPIQFLFARDAHDRIGGFNALYPVLGDWDFNLRFLQQFDIDFVPSATAYYHHRAAVPGNYANSLYGSQDKHLLWESRLRNRLLRGDYGDFGRFNGAEAIASSRWFRDLRSIVQHQAHEAESRDRHALRTLDALRGEIQSFRAQDSAGQRPEPAAFPREPLHRLEPQVDVESVGLDNHYNFVQVRLPVIDGSNQEAMYFFRFGAYRGNPEVMLREGKAMPFTVWPPKSQDSYGPYVRIALDNNRFKVSCKDWWDALRIPDLKILSTVSGSIVAASKIVDRTIEEDQREAWSGVMSRVLMLALRLEAKITDRLYAEGAASQHVDT